MHLTIPQDGKKLCRCCGFRFSEAASGNPHICRDCDELLADDSPMVIARRTEAAISLVRKV